MVIPFCGRFCHFKIWFHSSSEQNPKILHERGWSHGAADSGRPGGLDSAAVHLVECPRAADPGSSGSPASSQIGCPGARWASWLPLVTCLSGFTLPGFQRNFFKNQTISVDHLHLDKLANSDKKQFGWNFSDHLEYLPCYRNVL